MDIIIHHVVLSEVRDFINVEVTLCVRGVEETCLKAKSDTCIFSRRVLCATTIEGVPELLRFLTFLDLKLD